MNFDTSCSKISYTFSTEAPAACCLSEPHKTNVNLYLLMISGIISYSTFCPTTLQLPLKGDLLNIMLIIDVLPNVVTCYTSGCVWGKNNVNSDTD